MVTIPERFVLVCHSLGLYECVCIDSLFSLVCVYVCVYVYIYFGNHIADFMCLSSVGARMFVCVRVSYVSVYLSVLKGGYTFVIFVCMYR